METFVVVIVIGAVVLFLMMAVSNAQTGEQMERKVLREIARESEGMQKWLVSGDTSGLSEKETARINASVARGLARIERDKERQVKQLQRVKEIRSQHFQMNKAKYEEAKTFASDSFSKWVNYVAQSHNGEATLEQIADYHLRCVADALSKSGINFSGDLLIEPDWLQVIVRSHASQFEMDYEVLKKGALDLTTRRFQEKDAALQSVASHMSLSQFTNSPAYKESRVLKFWNESYAQAFGET